MSAPDWVAFLLAAGIGAPARYLIDLRVQDRTPTGFPWGTLTVNLLGCTILGVLTGMGLYHGLGATPRTVLGTGGMGALTTFSTFTYETVRLVEEDEWDRALRYVGASVLLGLGAAAVGIAAAGVL